MTYKSIGTFILCGFFVTSSVFGGGSEDSNTCRDDPSSSTCERAGTCTIQGSAWFQTVYVDKSDRFDTQGWPGLCDMVHVSLVQGDCEDIGAQFNITAYLSDVTYALVPSVSGSLACGDLIEEPVAVEICDDLIDNDGDGRVDCADKKDCRKDSYCR